jgi:hypothetical protein
MLLTGSCSRSAQEVKERREERGKRKENAATSVFVYLIRMFVFIITEFLRFGIITSG